MFPMNQAILFCWNGDIISNLLEILLIIFLKIFKFTYIWAILRSGMQIQNCVLISKLFRRFLDRSVKVTSTPTTSFAEYRNKCLS